MSKQRPDNRPVTRRYVLRVVGRARDEIISAILHATPPDAMAESTVEATPAEYAAKAMAESKL